MEFAHGRHNYHLLAKIGSAEEAIFYKAKYIPDDVFVGIMVVDMSETTNSIYELMMEATMARIYSHQNILKVHCSFKNVEEEEEQPEGNNTNKKKQKQLWIVMDLTTGFSLKTLISNYFPSGLPPSVIPFVLGEILKGLCCAHDHGCLHRYLNSDSVFIMSEQSIFKLAFHSLSYKPICETASTCELQDWMVAPELILYPLSEPTKKADIWMFGLLALEFYYGHVPASNLNALIYLVTHINHQFHPTKKRKKKMGSSFLRNLLGQCFSNSHGLGHGDATRKTLPKSLGNLLALCLSVDPSMRPTARQLMDHEFFQKASTTDSSLQELLSQLKIP